MTDVATALAAMWPDQTTHQTVVTSQPPIAKPPFSPEAQALASPVRASICSFCHARNIEIQDYFARFRWWRMDTETCVNSHIIGPHC